MGDSGDGHRDGLGSERTDGGDPQGGRPWTPAAAMEPVPPLAPPPARPGSGVAISDPAPLQRRGPGPLTTAVSLGAVLLVAAVIAVLVLTLGR